VLHTGTDSLGSLLIKFKPAPKDFRPLVTELLESSLEVPETPVITLEKMRQEDDHINDSNIPSHLRGPWSTATDRT
jgi:hypothetical protein